MNERNNRRTETHPYKFRNINRCVGFRRVDRRRVGCAVGVWFFVRVTDVVTFLDIQVTEVRGNEFEPRGQKLFSAANSK